MDKRELINVSEFQKYIFWNYKPGAELDRNIIIENVLLYGELEDFRKLIKLVALEDIRNVTDIIEKKGRFKKRVNFIRKVVLSD
ncbi:MAG: hypothetical protein R3A12_19350 [Ignavibacteria bacterium]